MIWELYYMHTQEGRVVDDETDEDSWDNDVDLDSSGVRRAILGV